MIIKSRTLFLLYLAFVLTLSTTIFQGCKKEEPKPIISISNPEKSEYTPDEEVVLKARCTDEDNLLFVGYFVFGPQGDTLFSEVVNNSGKTSEFVEKLNTSSTRLPRGDYSFKIIAANDIHTIESAKKFSIKYPEINSSLATYGIITRNNSTLSISDVQILNSNFNVIGSYFVDYGGNSGNSFPHFYAYGDKIYSSDTYYHEIRSFDKLSGENFKNHNDLYRNGTLEPVFHRGDQLYIYNHDINYTINRFSTSGSNTMTFPTNYGHPYSFYQTDERLITNEKYQGISRLVVYHKSTGAEMTSLNVPSNLNIEGFYDLGDPNRIYFITQSSTSSYTTLIWYYNRSLNSISQLSTQLSTRPKYLNPIVMADGANSKAWIFTDQGVYEHKVGDAINRISLSTTNNTSFSYINNYEYSKDNGILLYHGDYGVSASYDVKNNSFLNEFNYNEKVVLLKD
ncbi:MAG: hypothetical protein ACPGEG_04330 [Salibacteraceae bacterium]